MKEKELFERLKPFKDIPIGATETLGVISDFFEATLKIPEEIQRKYHGIEMATYKKERSELRHNLHMYETVLKKSLALSSSEATRHQKYMAQTDSPIASPINVEKTEAIMEGRSIVIEEIQKARSVVAPYNQMIDDFNKEVVTRGLRLQEGETALKNLKSEDKEKLQAVEEKILHLEKQYALAIAEHRKPFNPILKKFRLDLLNVVGYSRAGGVGAGEQTLFVTKYGEEGQKAIFQLLLVMSKMLPMNELDAPENQKVYSSIGYQFDLEALIKFNTEKKPPQKKHPFFCHTVNKTEPFKSPIRFENTGGNVFSSLDLSHFKQVAKERGLNADSIKLEKNEQPYHHKSCSIF